MNTFLYLGDAFECKLIKFVFFDFCYVFIPVLSQIKTFEKKNNNFFKDKYKINLLKV